MVDVKKPMFLVGSGLRFYFIGMNRNGEIVGEVESGGLFAFHPNWNALRNGDENDSAKDTAVQSRPSPDYK